VELAPKGHRGDAVSPGSNLSKPINVIGVPAFANE
jgi:hypothetical protein